MQANQYKQDLNNQELECQVKRTELIRCERIPAASPSTKLPLVLIHGWGNSSHCWQTMLEDLKQERELYLLDLPACGKNTSTADFDLPSLLNALDACLPKQCYLLGWSLGGMLATQLAAHANAKVDALVTLASNPCFVARESWPTAMDRETYETFLQNFQSKPAATYKKFIALEALGASERKTVLREVEKLAGVPGDEQLASWQKLLALLQEIDNVEVLKQLECSGLHLFAENDALVPAAVAEQFANIPAQEAQVLPACGHAFPVSNAQTVMQVLKPFLGARDRQFQGREQKQRVARAFSRAAQQYDLTAQLQRQVANNLLEMYEFESRPAKLRMLDLACGTGFASEAALRKASTLELALLDLSDAMLTRAREKLASSGGAIEFISADMDDCELEPSSYDLVVSSMSLQWSGDLPALLTRIYQSLKPGGEFLFATVGESTLHELAQAWRKVDDFTHVNSFIGFQDLRELLIKQGFVCEDARRELHIQLFNDVLELMKSLKAVGAHTINTGNNHGLTTRARLQALQEAYESFRNERDLLPASWEVLYFLVKKRG